MQTISRTRMEYLKGFVILAVMVNHYLNYLVWERTEHLANRLVAVLFVLSGIGIYYSLNKYLDKPALRIPSSKIIAFYWQRIVKIYPLYILSFFLLYSDKVDWLMFLGVRAWGIFWFICAIIHCYLLAPFLFLLVKKNKPTKLIGVFSFSFIFLNIIFIFLFKSLPEIFLDRPFFYLNIFFAYLLLFVFGLALPEIISQRKVELKYKNLYFLLFIIFLIATGFSLSWFMTLFLSILLLVSTVLFVSTFVLSEKKLFLQSVFVWLGKYIFPLYLFHYLYFYILKTSGLLGVSILSNTLITIIFSPLFLLVVWLIFKINYYFFELIKK